MRASACHTASTNRRAKERPRKDSLDGVMVHDRREELATMTRGRGGSRARHVGSESSGPVVSPYFRWRTVHSAASEMGKTAFGLSPERSAGSLNRPRIRSSPALAVRSVHESVRADLRD